MKTPLQGKRFYCREWVFSKLVHYMDDNGILRGNKPASANGCLIIGGAGCGKTAVCMEIIRPSVVISRQSEINARLLAHHFCHTHENDCCSPGAFILSLVQQLNESPLLGADYRERLSGSPDPNFMQIWLDRNVCDRYPVDAFKKLILEPLLCLPKIPQETLCIIVDSLHDSCSAGMTDDGRCSGNVNSPSILDLLAQVYRLFPSWIFLICTARKQCKLISKYFCDLKRLQLDDLRRSCVVRDVQQYILRRLDEDETLRSQLNLETAELLNQLHIKSNGCILYLELVLDCVVEQFTGLREIKHIPSTLNGLYLWLCQRLFCKKKFSRIQALLNVLLAVGRRPLTWPELYECVRVADCNIDQQEFVDLLQSCLSRLLMIDEAGLVSFFHNSFAEWLLDVKYSTQKFLCDKTLGHAHLAGWYSCRAQRLDESEIVDFAYHLTKISGLLSQNGGVGFSKSLIDPLRNKVGIISSPPPGGAPLRNVSIGSPSGNNIGVGIGDDNDFSNPGLNNITAYLALWLLQCGADVHNLVLKNYAVDEGTARLLVEAGADFVSLDFQGSQIAAEDNNSPGLFLPTEELEETSKNVEIDLALVDDTWVDQEGRTTLHKFAAEGCTDIVRNLLNKGAFCDVEDADGNTPLLLAARQGHAEVCDLLLDAGAESNRVNAAGWTPLRSASWGGHLRVVQILLKYDVVVDCSSADGRTALRAASWGGHDECVVALLAAGANPNKADVEGRTPLIAAAYMGHNEIVEILLDADADVNHKDKDGRSALCVASLCSSVAIDHTQVAKLLLERGADVQCEDNNGKTPLICAAAENRYEMCQLLLAYGADVDHCDANQCTPLLAAAATGHGKIIDLLLISGACLDTVDGEGRTVLTVAASYGSSEVVRTLLDKGLDEMHKDNHSWIPLHHAAFEGQTDVCRLLAQHNPKTVHVVDHEGRHPLILAVEEGHLEAVKALLDFNAQINKPTLDGRTSLRIACVDGLKDMTHTLISRGADVNRKDLDGTPIVYALIYEKQLEMAQFLLSYGTDVDGRDANGRSSLHVACWHGDPLAVEMLCKYGADVNAVDSDKRTPLMIAVWRGHTVVAKYLLQNRADANAECAEGATALSIAAQEGREDMVRLLLQYHASCEHTDSYGRNAAVVAMKAGHERLALVLQDFLQDETLLVNNNKTTDTAMSGGSNNSSEETKTSGFLSLSQALCSSLESPFHTIQKNNANFDQTGENLARLDNDSNINKPKRTRVKTNSGNSINNNNSSSCNIRIKTGNSIFKTHHNGTNCNTSSSTKSAGIATGTTSSTLSSSCGSPEEDFSRRLLEKSLPRAVSSCRPQSIVLATNFKTSFDETSSLLSAADELKLNELASAVREAVSGYHGNGGLGYHGNGYSEIGAKNNFRNDVEENSSSHLVNDCYTANNNRETARRADSCLQFLNDCIQNTPKPANRNNYSKCSHDLDEENNSITRRRNQIITNANLKTRQKPVAAARNSKTNNNALSNNSSDGGMKKETQL